MGSDAKPKREQGSNVKFVLVCILTNVNISILTNERVSPGAPVRYKVDSVHGRVCFALGARHGGQPTPCFGAFVFPSVSNRPYAWYEARRVHVWWTRLQ